MVNVGRYRQPVLEKREGLRADCAFKLCEL